MVSTKLPSSSLASSSSTEPTLPPPDLSGSKSPSQAYDALDIKIADSDDLDLPQVGSDPALDPSNPPPNVPLDNPGNRPARPHASSSTRPLLPARPHPQAQPGCTRTVNNPGGNNVNGNCSEAGGIPFNNLPALTQWAINAEEHIKSLKEANADLARQLSAVLLGVAVAPTPQNSPKNVQGLRNLDESPASTHASPPAVNVEPESQLHRAPMYGALSDFAMANRLEHSLLEAFNGKQHNHNLCVPATMSQFDDVISAERVSVPFQPMIAIGLTPDLSREEEENLLGRFWDSLRCIYPVLSRADFMAYYTTLWRPWSSQSGRRPCCLVDAILAVAAQHSVGIIADDDHASIVVTPSYGLTMASNSEDMARLAIAFYHRSRSLLQSELNCPSIITVQTLTLLSIYQYHASRFEDAHCIIAKAFHVAASLKISQTPPEEMTKPIEELNARLWATMWTLDTNLSICLGHDPIHPKRDGSKFLPHTDISFAIQTDLTLWIEAQEGITWTTFQHQMVQLTTSTRDIQDGFNDKRRELLDQESCNRIVGDRVDQDSLATWLDSKVVCIDRQQRVLPRHLRVRRDYDKPDPIFPGVFTLDFQTTDMSVKVWLMYQRIHLEVHTHYLQMVLRRPFINAVPYKAGQASRTWSGTAERLASCAVEHAHALSYVLLGSQRLTDLFRGWPHLLQYQWSAFIVILTYLLGDNRCEEGFWQYTRAALLTALSTIELMSSTNPAARLMYERARDLVRAGSELLGKRLDVYEPPHTRNGDMPAMRDESLDPRTGGTRPHPSRDVSNATAGASSGTSVPSSAFPPPATMAAPVPSGAPAAPLMMRNMASGPDQSPSFWREPGTISDTSPLSTAERRRMLNPVSQPFTLRNPAELPTSHKVPLDNIHGKRYMASGAAEESSRLRTSGKGSALSARGSGSSAQRQRHQASRDRHHRVY